MGDQGKESEGGETEGRRGLEKRLQKELREEAMSVYYCKLIRHSLINYKDPTFRQSWARDPSTIF